MEEENKEQNKKNKIILWAAVILASIIAVVVLVMSIPGDKTDDKISVDSNKVIQIENKDPEKEDKEKTEKVITFSKNSIILSVGGSETLQVINDNSKDLAWSSSHPNIATVNNSGVVTAISMGTALITGQRSDGSIGSCTIVVKGSSFSGNENTENVPEENGTYTPSDSDSIQNPEDDFNDWNSNDGDINNEQPEIPVIDDPIAETITHTITFMLDGQILLTQEVEDGLTIGNIPQNPSKYRIYI